MDMGSATGLDNLRCILDIQEKEFENCCNLKETYFLQYVYTVGNHAFSHCTALETVKINGCLEVIGDSAYSNCTLCCNIEIPMTVKTIGRCAFYNCSLLQEVDMQPLTPPYIEDSTIFAGCANLRVINFWPSVYPDYIKHPVWGKFASLLRTKEMR